MRNTALSKELQIDLTPTSVLQDLLEGNQRYISNNLTASDIDIKYLLALLLVTVTGTLFAT